MAVMEYLQQHPEAAIPGAKIKVTYQPLQTREQLLELVKSMAKTAVEELLEGKILVPVGEQDIDAMVASLKLFDI